MKQSESPSIFCGNKNIPFAINDTLKRNSQRLRFGSDIPQIGKASQENNVTKHKNIVEAS